MLTLYLFDFHADMISNSATFGLLRFLTKLSKMKTKSYYPESKLVGSVLFGNRAKTI